MININDIDFKKGGGLVPVVVQDIGSQRVLMLGYMNEDALSETIRTQHVTFFSRAKDRLWTKGETSGHFLEMKEMLLDCDADTLLIKAIPHGPTCHTGTDTCFNEQAPWGLSHLENIIERRKNNLEKKSYTSSLFEKGINKIAQKVGEEAVELVIEAKDNNKELFLGEAADLLFHYLILLSAKGFSLDDVIDVLRARHLNQNTPPSQP